MFSINRFIQLLRTWLVEEMLECDIGFRTCGEGGRQALQSKRAHYERVLEQMTHIEEILSK